jgi:predicted Zn-dependent peptidase
MIQKTRLDNGLRVITERMPHVRSVSVGAWVEAGSRHEAAELNGVAHFIEHAVFKGTARRSALEIAIETDRQGGHLNASTGQETTCFHTRVLDEQLPQALDLIADLVAGPAFVPEEMERERSVIIEEIKMVEDTPDEFLHDVFTENFWPGHALGRPISGSVETVSSFTREDVLGFYRDRYCGSGIVLTAAGNLEHAEVVRLAERLLGNLPPGRPPAVDAPVSAPAFVLRHKDGLEQAHVMLGSPAPSMASPDRYAANLMSAVLGDGMSSRLFQRVREERGLVYGIGSSVESFLDTGLHEIYAGASPENIPEVIELIVAELSAFKEGGPTEDELRWAKEGFKVSTVLALESTFNRMSRLARHEMFYGRQVGLDELLARIDAITRDDVVRVAHDICRGDRLAITVLGEIDGLDLDRAALVAC